MDQTEARLLCAVLNAAGHQVIADNGGGWGGQGRSLIWGVRSAKGDATEGKVFTDPSAFPAHWLATLYADVPTAPTGRDESDAVTGLLSWTLATEEDFAWDRPTPTDES